MKKCVVLYNKQSGKNKKNDFLREFEKILKENDYEVSILQSQYKGHVTDIVASLNDDVDLVLSVGGDGTFNESMRGNFKRRNRLLLAHIPTGTTNDVGKMFGYSKNPVSNLKLLMDGVIKKMDICMINDNPFIYVAGFGKYMNISYETKRKSKRKFGYLAYVFNAMKNFCKKTKMHDITYQINNESFSGNYSFFAITNATRIAGVKVYDDIKLDDNKFEVIFCSIKKRKNIIKALIKFKRKGINNVAGIYFHRSNNLKIKVNDLEKITCCLDGEEFNLNENEIEVKVEQTKIMIPNKNVDVLFKKNKN